MAKAQYTEKQFKDFGDFYAYTDVFDWHYVNILEWKNGVASVGISKRNVKFWERWTGWYTFLVADLVADVIFEVAKGRGAVALFIAMFVAIAVFVAAGLWYCRWFDKVLKRTYVVNLIEKEKADVKKSEGNEKVSESESNS